MVFSVDVPKNGMFSTTNSRTSLEKQAVQLHQQTKILQWLYYFMTTTNCTGCSDNEEENQDQNISWSSQI